MVEVLRVDPEIFPGARNPEAAWKLIRRRKDSFMLQIGSGFNLISDSIIGDFDAEDLFVVTASSLRIWKKY
ncbi:hypothetical protein OPV22_002850 [Ensete ventricosum]|uniref:Uncharacterized protein n=1 Tax=Ensete ventricosum TaxID=4639 RepID=A0AAV8RZ42_ENSVE|nr:hypothetical protein OPV22_002850 [Ensete ventricosum]